MKRYIRSSYDSVLSELQSDLISEIESFGYDAVLDKAEITGQYYEVAAYAVADDNSRCRVYVGYSTYQYSDEQLESYGDVAKKPYSVLFNYGRKTRFYSRKEAFDFVKSGIQNPRNFR